MISKLPVIYILLLSSFLSLGLPKEVFDPHLGVDNDIFCKSLYAVGIEAAEPVFFFIKWEVFYKTWQYQSCIRITLNSFYAFFNKAPPLGIIYIKIVN
ncbi:MAG: hypothetical protein JW864_14435 [Spirochaetes bacterium]|nr:hypothetical protein [Spirochaetota bacterium]